MRIGELEVLDLVQGALPVQLEAAPLHALRPGAAALQHGLERVAATFVFGRELGHATPL